MNSQKALPYEGIRVVEFTHMVMGPTCGMVLGDLGAEVIKVEPIDGDKTRDLVGSGAGFFPMFNRGVAAAHAVRHAGQPGRARALARDHLDRLRPVAAAHLPPPAVRPEPRSPGRGRGGPAAPSPSHSLA
mgnify:CR=1 FL=1